MRLQAYSPLGIFQAILEGEPGILFAEGAIHGLEVKHVETESVEHFGHRAGLGEDQFEFVSGKLEELRSCFGAYAHPVNARRGGNGAVGLNGHFKSSLVQGLDQGVIEL